MIVALFDRIRKGKPVVEADPTLTHAGNFLWMLNGEKPSATRSSDGTTIRPPVAAIPCTTSTPRPKRRGSSKRSW